MWGRAVALMGLVTLGACDDGVAASDDDGGGDDTDGAIVVDASVDAAVAATLADHRDRLFRGNAMLGSGADVCARWTSLDVSRRAVFLTLTHRLFISELSDTNMLTQVTSVELILGGGSSGTACGSAENNRLFLKVSPSLWQLMVDTWNGERVVGDGGTATWIHTEDAAGPHDPFTGSDETDTGLSCLGLIELGGSRPPTAQAHFFLDGDAVPVDRGAIHLPADPYLLEIDHDFDCLHQSNPVCPNRSFDTKYAANYGDFECSWVPNGCTLAATGCYPAAQ